MVVLLVLNCALLGCWQEIRYEPTRSAQSKPKAPTSELTDQVTTPSLPAPDEWQSAGATEEPEPTAEVVPVPTNTSEEVSAAEVPVDAPSDAQVEETMPEVAADPFDELVDSESSSSVESPAESPGEPTAESPAEPTSAPDLAAVPVRSANAKTALAAWKLSSDWSMAAALQAKGQDVERYGEWLGRARDEAAMLGISMPGLPIHEAGTDQLQANLVFLLEDAGPRLANELRELYGPDHAAIAELATKTHVLLLSYTPESKHLEPVVASIRQAAENSGLPEHVWRGLVDQLSERADFKDVKAAVFKLHQQAAEHLAAASE